MSVLLRFGRGGSAIPHLLQGWSTPEDNFTWSLGTRSALSVNLPPGEGEAFLELAVNPYTEPGGPPRRLTVLANGSKLDEVHISGEGILGYRLPPSAEGTLLVEIDTDPARSPTDLNLGNDARKLGFMLRELRIIRVPPKPRVDVTVLPPFPVPPERDAMGRTIAAVTGGLDPRALSLCFEGLGHNCEFGLLQRHLGAEPIGLLRFAGITLDHLVDGLRRGFAGVGDEVVVRTHPTHNGNEEFLVYDDRYHIGLHSFRTTADTTAEAVKAEHAQRLHFARRQFNRWLKTGEKLFLFQRPGQITRAHALVVSNLLQNFGPNALMYVDNDPRLPSGAVEQVGYGLFHGKLDRMAPAEDVGNLDLLGWLSLAVNGWRLWQAHRKTFVVS
jgi:hypothetical protein